jgi:hypothetical protein
MPTQECPPIPHAAGRLSAAVKTTLAPGNADEERLTLYHREGVCDTGTQPALTTT